MLTLVLYTINNMEYYRNFDQLRVTELPVLRHGFWRPWYELTDGQFSYGKLTYSGALKRTCLLETATGSWVVKRKGWLSRKLTIEQSGGAEIGMITPEIWSRKILVELNDGFAANFFNKKLLSRTFTWVSEQYGDMLSVQAKAFSRNRPFIVHIDTNMVNTLPHMPLLALLGINLVLLKQAEAAAAS